MPAKKVDAFSDLYQKGYSLGEISKQTGHGKEAISKALRKNGIAIRSFLKSQNQEHDLTQVMRSGGVPFGYCYLEGKLVVDPRERKIVLEMYRQWQEGQSLRTIAKSLNDRKVPTRFGKTWRHEVVNKIIQRHQQELVEKSGGKNGTR